MIISKDTLTSYQREIVGRKDINAIASELEALEKAFAASILDVLNAKSIGDLGMKLSAFKRYLHQNGLYPNSLNRLGLAA